MLLKHLSEFVSQSCWRSMSCYFNHKSQYLINFKFVNIRKFRFFHCFPCMLCSINSLSSFRCEFFSVMFDWCFPRQYLFLTEMWFFHERCSSIKIPRNFIEVARSITFPLIANIENLKGILSFRQKLWEKILLHFPCYIKMTSCNIFMF